VWDSKTRETGDLDAEWDVDKIKSDLARDHAARRKAGPGGVSGVAESDKGVTGVVKDGKGGW
jgi:hypothetical protein